MTDCLSSQPTQAPGRKHQASLFGWASPWHLYILHCGNLSGFLVVQHLSPWQAPHNGMPWMCAARSSHLSECLKVYKHCFCLLGS